MPYDQQSLPLYGWAALPDWTANLYQWQQPQPAQPWPQGWPQQMQQPPPPQPPDDPNQQQNPNPYGQPQPKRKLTREQQMQQYGMSLLRPQFPGQGGGQGMPYGLAPLYWANPNQ